MRTPGCLAEAYRDDYGDDQHKDDKAYETALASLPSDTPP
jgi:hypothetical protein